MNRVELQQIINNVNDIFKQMERSDVFFMLYGPHDGMYKIDLKGVTATVQIQSNTPVLIQRFLTAFVAGISFGLYGDIKTTMGGGEKHGH